MKRVRPTTEPKSLANYRDEFPNAGWEEMKGDNEHKGDQAYKDCRAQLIIAQGGLCAYCEIKICNEDPLGCRIEHFHPKSDRTTVKNWALAWENMLAVCAGGSFRHGAPPYSMEPLDQNLSCDAHKDKLIQSNRLTDECEGLVINPLELPAFRNLFSVEKSTGRLIADPQACLSEPNIPSNRYGDLKALVTETISVLNLNCDRLCMARLEVIRHVERLKKKQRDEGFNAEQGLRNLCNRYFRTRWPMFFTTIRICLGSAAEDYLTQLNFEG